MCTDITRMTGLFHTNPVQAVVAETISGGTSQGQRFVSDVGTLRGPGQAADYFALYRDWRNPFRIDRTWQIDNNTTEHWVRVETRMAYYDPLRLTLVLETTPLM